MANPGPTVLSLCSGYAGLEIAVRSVWPEAQVQGYVEWDSYAASVLLARMEDSSLEPAPIWCGDLSELPTAPFLGVEAVVAGFPCQPWSAAGQGLGKADERWIWDDIARVIRQVGPRVVFLENVPPLITRGGLTHILTDLAEIGFDSEWLCLRASDVGAPHKRERVFLLAYATGYGDTPQAEPGRWAAQPPWTKDHRPSDWAGGPGREDVALTNGNRPSQAHPQQGPGPVHVADSDLSGGRPPGQRSHLYDREWEAFWDDFDRCDQDVADTDGGTGGGPWWWLGDAFGEGDPGPGSPGQASEPGGCSQDVADAGSPGRPEVARGAYEDEGQPARGATLNGHLADGSGQDVADSNGGGGDGVYERVEPGYLEADAFGGSYGTPSSASSWPPGPDDRDAWALVPPGAQPSLCRSTPRTSHWLGAAYASTDDQLRLLGNGVVPQQAAAALYILASRFQVAPSKESYDAEGYDPTEAFEGYWGDPVPEPPVVVPWSPPEGWDDYADAWG